MLSQIKVTCSIRRQRSTFSEVFIFQLICSVIILLVLNVLITSFGGYLLSEQKLQTDTDSAFQKYIFIFCISELIMKYRHGQDD